MPRFVILEHDFPERHFDFMLEDGGVLLTWRLAQWPLPHSSREPATQLADHRLHYLDYEGPVSGNRGTVLQQDSGTYHWLQRSPTGWKIHLQRATDVLEVTVEAVNHQQWFTCVPICPDHS